MHTLRGVPQVNTPDHLESSLKKAAAMLVAEEYRLLVVDSIIAPFRFEYCGCVRPVKRPPPTAGTAGTPSSGREHLLSLARRGELAERQQRLGAVLVTLKKMAEEARAAR